MSLLSNTKLFAFDFDGTLVQSNAIKSSAFFDVTNHLPDARTHLENIFKTRPGLDRYGVFNALAEFIDDIEPVALAEAYGKKCREQILICPEVPGTSYLLKKLMDTNRVVIINSATPEKPLREVVDQLSIGNFIKATFGEPSSKAENLEKAMSLFDVTPDQTAMVGDRESDRVGAQEVGCKFIGIQSDLTDYIAKPQYAVKQLDEIAAWL